jgi:phosphopantothenoylcysteine decarboxylase/phosphopantothenate--cysteine ligase
LAKKGLDIIVANNITESGSGFGAEDNKVTIIERSGQIEDVPVMSKRAVADRILDKVVKLITDKPLLKKT